VGIGRAALIVFSIATIFSIGLAPNPAYAQSTLYGIAFIGPNGLSQLYTINTTTGVATAVGSGIGFERCSAMDFDPSTGILYALCERPVVSATDVEVLITINLITGVGSEVGPTNSPAGSPFAGMSFRNSDGAVYSLLDEGFAHDMYTVNIGTGQATDLSAGSIGLTGNAVAFSPADTLYLASASSLIIVNQVTGGVVGTPVFNGNVNRINGMDFDPGTGVLWGVHNQGTGGTNRSLVTINVSNFALLTSVSLIDGMDAIAFLPEEFIIGGTIIPLDQTALLLAGVQSVSMWMIPVVLSGIGIGVFVIKRRN